MAKRAIDTSVKFTMVHGYRRAYRMAGSGPALLLLHGIADSSESWEPLIPELAKRFTVIAPDLLGHGQSAKPRADYSVAAYANGMRDLLDVLGIGRVTVVGHSLGGGVAAQLAYQYPARVERLVLVASGGVDREVSFILRAAAAPLAEFAVPLAKLPVTRFVGQAALRILRLVGHDLGRDADEVMRVFDGMPDGESAFAFTRTLRSVVDWQGQLVTMLDRTYLVGDAPVMLMWGEHDAIIPVEHAHRAHAALPSSRLELYPEAGHFPHHTDPLRFVSDLVDFIDETQPATHRPDEWRQRLRTGSAIVATVAAAG